MTMAALMLVLALMLALMLAVSTESALPHTALVMEPSVKDTKRACF
jgi:hypothetical protein